MSFENLQSSMVAVVGIPFDANSSFMQGSALAPAQILKALNLGAPGSDCWHPHRRI
jgi:arginase family enzyme